MQCSRAARSSHFTLTRERIKGSQGQGKKGRIFTFGIDLQPHVLVGEIAVLGMHNLRRIGAHDHGMLGSHAATGNAAMPFC